jgi:hypothetical protein
MFDFLKKLFGGGQSPSETEDRGIYFYVRPKRCQEVVRVRIDPMNDLSMDDENQLYVRKMVRGGGCPFPAELVVTFTVQRNVQDATVDLGELVDAAAYQAYQDSKTQANTPPQGG